MNVFDVNRPASLDAIQQYIGGYATPEAAVADTQANAPRGMDYLTSSYQRATGDAFADPFADAESARSRALIQAAVQGFGVTTGSRATGGSVSTSANPLALDAPHPVAVDPTAAAANSQPQMRGITPNLPNLMGMPTNTAAPIAEAAAAAIHPSAGSGGGGVATLQQGPMAGLLNYDYRNAAGTLNPSNMGSMEQRVRAAGVDPTNPIVKRILSNPAAVASDGMAGSNMLRDKTGKIIPADALHHIAFDPEFQALANNPATAGQAQMLYKAIAGTNRDYGTDYQAHSQFIAGQRGMQDKLIESIKNPYVHPVTGQIYHTADVKDMMGNLTSQEMPISDAQQAALDARGGFKSVYGFDLPKTSGLARPDGMDDEAYAAYKQLTMQKLGNIARPTADQVNKASQVAHAELYAKYGKKPDAATGVASNEPSPDLLGMLHHEDFERPIQNRVRQLGNWIFRDTGKTMFPLLPTDRMSQQEALDAMLATNTNQPSRAASPYGRNY